VACAANLRSILQGMQIYVAQNKGYFPGGANSSGAFLVKGTGFSDTNCPEVSTVFDWQAPIALVTGVEFERGGTASQRIARFQRLNAYAGFRCPEVGDEVLMAPFNNPNAGTLYLTSYNTAILFQGTSSGTEGLDKPQGNYTLPPGYSPKISSVNNAAKKIYIADGARYTNGKGDGPDYDFSYLGKFGGPFSDIGAFSSFSNSWDRRSAPGNPGGSRDARIFSFRHGTTKAGAGGDSFRFNAGFFDGHVETLGDLEGADPALWMPTGTSISGASGEMYPDVASAYLRGSSTYVAP
jgi:prepilin-type processing-associated H-X9-DG protein